MPYNTLAQAQARVGNEITQENLNDARSLLDMYSEYRWESTIITQTFSGGQDNFWLDLRLPVISVTSLTIDDVAQTEDTDFELRRPEGRIRLFSSLPWGHDNIVVVYVYGFTGTSGDPEVDFYTSTINMVKNVEASLALYLRKNPLQMKQIDIEGGMIAFDDNQIEKILCRLPKPFSFIAVDNIGINEPDNERML